MTDLYEQNLWGKIEYLHERFQREHNHILNFVDMMKRFQNACSDFSKSINNILNKKYILTENNTSTIYKSMESYYKCLKIHAESFNDIFESLKSYISNITKSISESFQKEKEMHNSYMKTLSIYNNQKINLEKMVKEFKQKGKECENLVYNAKKARIFSTATQEQILKMESIATQSLANTALFEDKYLKSLNETNKSRENEINLQKKLQSYYRNLDIDIYGNIRMMTGFFITCLKRMFNSISMELESLNGSFNNINIEKDIKDFVEKYKTNAKPDPVIKFIPLNPSPEIISSSIFDPNSDDKKDLEISYEVILVFQRLFRKIRTDLNMEEEAKKNKIRILSNKLIKPGQHVFYTDKEKKELFYLLKNPNYRSSFLLLISKQRTKGYKKNQNLLNDLTEILLYILELAEKEKDLESAMYCILLSQTYYCEIVNKENNLNEKLYLLNGIKNNKWLNQIVFWEDIINMMIQKEIEKNEVNSHSSEKKKKENIKKIVQTQIFNNTTNMSDFNFNKNDIFLLIEKLCKKYEIEKDEYELIINNIIKTNERESQLKENKKSEEEKNKIEEEDNKKEEIIKDDINIRKEEEDDENNKDNNSEKIKNKNEDNSQLDEENKIVDENKEEEKIEKNNEDEIKTENDIDKGEDEIKGEN